MLKFMLDSNTCIFTIKNKPDQVRQAFGRHQGRNVSTCFGHSLRN